MWMNNVRLTKKTLSKHNACEAEQLIKNVTLSLGLIQNCYYDFCYSENGTRN